MNQTNNNRLYLLETGILWDNCSDIVYWNVYDKKHAYFDEDQYYITDFETAKKEAMEYVQSGNDTTYAIISLSQMTTDNLSIDCDNIDELEVSNEAYDVQSVVFSLVKINGVIVENFVDTDLKTTQKEGT